MRPKLLSFVIVGLTVFGYTDCGNRDFDAQPSFNVIEGRIVSTSDLCAGLGIQILSGIADYSKFNVWSECNGTYFNGVFWTYLCEMDEGELTRINELWSLNEGKCPIITDNRFRFVIEEYDVKWKWPCIYCDVDIPDKDKLRIHKIRVLDKLN